MYAVAFASLLLTRGARGWNLLKRDGILVLTIPGNGWLKIHWSSARDLSVTWAEPKS